MGEIREIPVKSSYKSAEVCRYTGTQPYVLRFWESEFPQLSPQRSQGGNTVYSRQDIATILRIKELLYDEDCTIATARERLEEELAGGMELDDDATTGGTPGADSPRHAPGPHPTEDDETAADESPEMPTGDGGDRAASAMKADPKYDMVSRERYEDALDEIAHLRLQLKDAEARGRKSESLLEKTQQALARQEQQTSTAVASFEKLLRLLS